MDRNLKFIGLGAAVRWFGTSMVYPYIGLYLRNILGVGYVEIGAILFVIAAIPLLVAPFGGLLADRAGRRKVLLFALAGETAGVITIAVSMGSANFIGIVTGGIATGIAGNIQSPASSAYIADYATGSERSRAYSWYRIGFNVGFTVGVASGGLLVAVLGFTGTGFVSAAILSLATIMLTVLLSPSPYDLARTKSGTPLLASAAGHVSIRDSFRILVRDKNFLAMSLAFTFGNITYSHWNTTFPLFVNSVLEVPYWVLGSALALNGAIVIFGQAPITHAMTGRRHTTSATLAITMVIGAFVALGFFTLFQGGVLLAVFSFVIVLTLGENFAAIPFLTLPSNMAPAGEIGSYNGAFTLITGIGAALAPSFGGLALSSISNPFVLWFLLALSGVPAILLFRWLGGRIPTEINRV
jgi:MFS family permease